MWLVKKIKRKLWSYLKNIFYYERIYDSPLVLNINYSVSLNQKNALICYLTRGHFNDIAVTSSGRTQPYEILVMEEVLSSYGYSIDLINCNDINVLPLIKRKKYDLILGFGETFYQMATYNPGAISIYYLTENPPDFSFNKEEERLHYYYQRHGQKFKYTRSGKFYQIKHIKKRYDFAITMGEVNLLTNLYSNPYFIFPTGLVNSRYVFSPKNHSASRKNFLWFGSIGAVHKGLDLLIDLFFQYDDIVLHVCGLDKKEKKALSFPKKNNIIDYGHIDVNSDLFLTLIDKCSYVVLPSCSEGCSTGILTGMLHGLIPIVLKDVGFNNLGQHAIFLNDFKIEYLKEKFNEIADFNPLVLNQFSKDVFDFARNNFTITNFRQSFREIFANILSSIHL